MQGQRWLVGCLGLLFSCGAPDRAYVEGSRGWGSIDGGGKPEGYDTDDYALTVGVEVPLGTSQERTRREPCPLQHWPPALPTAQPATSGAEGSAIPWEELILIAGTVAGTVGAQKGHKRYKAYSSRKKAAC